MGLLILGSEEYLLSCIVAEWPSVCLALVFVDLCACSWESRGVSIHKGAGWIEWMKRRSQMCGTGM